jgi:signal transduction histidine kinase
MLSLVQVPHTAAAHELVLQHVTQGIFALDANDAIVPPMSQSLATLFRRDDFPGARFADLLQPIVTKKFLGIACQHLAALRAAPQDPASYEPNPLRDLEVRFANGNGSNDLLHFSFEFTPMNIPGESGTLLVRVTDQTTALLQAREIEDLRLQLQTQGDILKTVLCLGNTRFAAIVRSTDKSMNSINEILRRPAREQTAFRAKLEQAFREVDRIGRHIASTSLGSLSAAAKRFETALVELRGRELLSGNDFLPLAVKLDDLHVQFSLVQSLTTSPDAPPAPQFAGDGDGASRPAAGGADLTAAPKFVAQLLERQSMSHASTNASAGTLGHTFARLTENAAHEHAKPVALKCSGLQRIPPVYQSTVKNIVIQFIRNAVLHGIESPPERAALGKPRVGQLSLDFATRPDGSFELTFEDDGRGIDADAVRHIAISKALITRDAAAGLGDRQALKIIFKSRFTTLPQLAGEKKHGTGLAFVRRYVHDAGGVISLGSDPGRATRFKVGLPALALGSAVASDETHVA